MKIKKNNWKNQVMKKNWLKFWKNQPVRFRFYKSETEQNRAELNPNKKKQKKTEPNWKNQIKPVWNSFCPKKLNRTEPKPNFFKSYKYFY